MRFGLPLVALLLLLQGCPEVTDNVPWALATAGDDDDATADDDDATPPEPDSFVGTTYCLDWTSITFSEPPNLLASLSVVGLTLQDYPLLAEPTAVDLVNDDIWFLTGTAQTGTCEQNLAVGTTDLTATGPGSYVDPHFEVGPMPFSITASVTTLDIFELEFTGDFTADHAQIINGTLGGELDITTYAATCGFLSWTCFPCTGNPSATCVYVAGTGGVWTDNGLGPLTPVP